MEPPDGDHFAGLGARVSSILKAREKRDPEIKEQKTIKMENDAVIREEEKSIETLQQDINSRRAKNKRLEEPIAELEDSKRRDDCELATIVAEFNALKGDSAPIDIPLRNVAPATPTSASGYYQDTPHGPKPHISKAMTALVPYEGPKKDRIQEDDEKPSSKGGSTRLCNDLPTIIKFKDETDWTLISCPCCGANANKLGKFFDGMVGLTTHMHKSHEDMRTKDGKKVKYDWEVTRTMGCGKILSQDQIERVRDYELTVEVVKWTGDE